MAAIAAACALAAPVPPALGAPADPPELLAPAASSRSAVTMTVRVPLRSSMYGVQAAVDRCDGPVATRHPHGQLISQHDYCSNRWVLRLHRGDRVRFRGKVRGLYQVRAIAYRRRGTGTFADLPRWVGGTVQAGMCASSTMTKWVGFRRLR